MTVSDSHFKGWAKPGPVPPGASREVDVPAGKTLDALSGHYRIYQLRGGHRFSTDDLLTGWYGTTWVPTAARVLDLGSGIGSVGMIAAWRLPGSRVVAVEAQDESARLARKSLEYNGLLERCEIRHADFRDPAALSAGEHFDLVLGSPPLIRLFACMRAGDLPEAMRAGSWEEPPLTIRTADGAVHPEYAAVKLAVGFPP